jgi:hypothetical protein
MPAALFDDPCRISIGLAKNYLCEARHGRDVDRSRQVIGRNRHAEIDSRLAPMKALAAVVAGAQLITAERAEGLATMSQRQSECECLLA